MITCPAFSSVSTISLLFINIVTMTILATVQDEEEEQGMPSGPIDKSVPYQLEVDDEGWPLLPHSKEVTLHEIKQIVRSYVTLIYRACMSL
jgi:hypothetical protein